MGVGGNAQREKHLIRIYVFNKQRSILGRWRADIIELETSYLRTDKVSSDWRISENKYNVCHEYAFAG